MVAVPHAEGSAFLTVHELGGLRYARRPRSNTGSKGQLGGWVAGWLTPVYNRGNDTKQTGEQ